MSFHFPATGTLWQIDVFGSELNHDLKEKITNFVEDFEVNYSRFRETSFVSKLAKKPGVYQIPNTAKTLLDFYTKLNNLTSGIFTPTIGDTLVSAGYDKSYSLTPQQHLKSAADWSDISYDEKNISSKKVVQLDFGAAGKGYLVDLVANLLLENNYKNFCIDAGGDIKIAGDIPQTIGLEHPTDKASVIGTIEIKDSSLCGSSGNRRKWANYHHIISPKEKSSPDNILSTWVKSQNCLTADGLATAIFLVNPQILKSHFEFDYLILNSDYTTNTSLNFSATLFTENV